MKVRAVWKKTEQHRQELSTLCRDFKKPVLQMFCIYLIGISAILRANVSYIDDVGRANQGFRGWLNFSRYITEYLSVLVHANTVLTDISPLPQMIAAALLAIATVVTIYLITEKRQISWACLIAAVPLGLSPYFLECISYKFDSPYMALSILASVVPVLFYSWGEIVYFAAAAAGAVVVCTTYQAASGIFPMLVLLLAFSARNRGEEGKPVLRFTLLSAGGYLAGLLFFRAVLMRSHEASYTSTDVPGLAQLPATVISNLRTYGSLILKDFHPVWTVLSVLVGAAFVTGAVLAAKRNKVQAFIEAGLTAGGMLILSCGIYMLLEHGAFTCRSMYGFGAFLAFVAVYAVSTQKRTVCCLPMLALSWCFFVFSFTYGNALNRQEEYTEYRMETALEDVKALDMLRQGEHVDLKITGTIGYAPFIQTALEEYEVLDRLMPVLFTETGYFLGGYRFCYEYGLPNVTPVAELAVPREQMELVADNVYHTIYAGEGEILIELKAAE